MQRDPLSATLLIAGSLTIVLVMSHHPTGAAIMNSENAERHVRLAATVHAVAILAVATLFLGFVGVSRWLGFPNLAIAALVAYGLGGLAAVSAAVVSGFVAPEIILRGMQAQGAAAQAFETARTHAWLMNQGFARVHVAASSIAVVLWALALLRVGRAEQIAGVAGLLVGLITLGVFVAGAVALNVRGFGTIMVAQSTWVIWLGMLLLRRDMTAQPPNRPTAGSTPSNSTSHGHT